MYEIVFTRTAAAELPKLKAAGLTEKTKLLMNILRSEPYQELPSFRKLRREGSSIYIRNINVFHKLIYEIYDEEKVIKIISAR